MIRSYQIVVNKIHTHSSQWQLRCGPGSEPQTCIRWNALKANQLRTWALTAIRLYVQIDNRTKPRIVEIRRLLDHGRFWTDENGVEYQLLYIWGTDPITEGTACPYGYQQTWEIVSVRQFRRIPVKLEFCICLECRHIARSRNGRGRSMIHVLIGSHRSNRSWLEYTLLMHNSIQICENSNPWSMLWSVVF